MAVGKKVKKLAAGFYGRLAAYEQGLEQPAPALEDALARNALAGPKTAPSVAAAAANYVRWQWARLAAAPDQTLRDGAIHFAGPDDAGMNFDREPTP